MKIVDAVGDVPAAAGAVVSYAGEQGLVQVTWEGWTVSAEDAVASGFAPLRPPLTREGPGAGGPGAGYVRWLVAEDVAEPAYYRQSTGFTCAAVTALVARAQAGAERWESLDRAAELTLWRNATNFPACERRRERAGWTPICCPCRTRRSTRCPCSGRAACAAPYSSGPAEEREAGGRGRGPDPENRGLVAGGWWLVAGS